MTRDNEERLALYTRQGVEVRRLALNLNQVRRYRPPPNFAKEKDPKLKGYIKRFGSRECWELDALSPTVISNLIRAQLEPLIDRKRWKAAEEQERQGRSLLTAVAKDWPKIAKLMKR
jgi:hypothetical protein